MPWRRPRAGWPAGAVVGLLLLASSLSAQTLPVPTLPREEPPGAGPTPQDPAAPAAAPEGALRLPWEYRLGVGVGYDSNIDFRIPDGPSSWAVSPRGELSRLFRSPRGELRLGGTGSWVGYPEQEELNRYNAGASLEGTYRSSPKTTWRGRAAYDFGYSDSSQMLSDQGVLLPLVQTWTVAGALGVTRMLAQRTSFRLDGRFYHTEFDEEDAGALGLVDGESMRGTASLEHRIGTQETLALEYSLENTLGRLPPDATEEDGGRYYLTHFGSLQWNHLFSPRSGFLLEAGASYTPDAERAGLDRRESFYGGLSYTRQVRDSSVTLFARREVIPAFGLGVSRIENRFGLRATIPMGHSWMLRLDGTHMQPDTPEEAAFSYGSPDEATVVLSWRPGRRFEVSGEGRYRRRAAAGAYPEIESYQVGLYLSLVNPRGAAAPRAGR